MWVLPLLSLFATPLDVLQRHVRSNPRRSKTGTLLSRVYVCRHFEKVFGFCLYFYFLQHLSTFCHGPLTQAKSNQIFGDDVAAWSALFSKRCCRWLRTSFGTQTSPRRSCSPWARAQFSIKQSLGAGRNSNQILIWSDVN